MLTWHLAPVHVWNCLRILTGWRKPLKETLWTSCSVCIWWLQIYCTAIISLCKALKIWNASFQHLLQGWIFIEAHFKADSCSVWALLFWSLRMKTEALMSSSSYFPTESRVNEGSHCEVSCNLLLWIKLLFKDERCCKINIPFLLCATHHEWDPLHVHEHTHEHTLVQMPFHSYGFLVWAFASGSSYLKSEIKFC